MGIGALCLRLQQRLDGDLPTIFNREWVRRQVLRARPLTRTSEPGICEVHMLTSADDWLNALWSLRSFYHFADIGYGLCIHDDGTLDEASKTELRRQFPGVRLIERCAADDSVSPMLASFPQCRRFRETNKLALKIFDVVCFAQARTILLLDSDVLFFSYPGELIERIAEVRGKRNYANRDAQSAYTISLTDAASSFGVKLIERFNSGLCILRRDSLQLDWFEEFLSRENILSHHWRIEQTLLALASSRHGVELLPPEYDVRLDAAGGPFGPCRHYVGAIRHLMYREGVRILSRTALLQQRGS